MGEESIKALPFFFTAINSKWKENPTQMTDVEYVYRQDVREKKRISYGARNKVNGSKSKKCTLPSDYLTRKEKMALNGEVKTWDLKKFYSWEEFKKMPDEVMIEYINSIINRYGVGTSAISKYVFGMAEKSLYQFLSRRNELQYINIRKKGGKPKPKDIERLRMDIDLSKNPPIAKVTSVDETNQGLKVEADLTPEGKEFMKKAYDTIPAIPEPVESDTNISDFLIRMDKFDDSVWDMMKDLFAYTDEIQITISVTPKGS